MLSMKILASHIIPEPLWLQHHPSNTPDKQILQAYPCLSFPPLPLLSMFRTKTDSSEQPGIVLVQLTMRPSNHGVSLFAQDQLLIKWLVRDQPPLVGDSLFGLVQWSKSPKT